MTTLVNHLDRLAIIQPDFSIWCGKVKLDDPDLKLGIGGEIPPKELVELGSKYVINKTHLRPFNRLKTKVRRLCLAHGMSFMSGFAVPLDKIDQISIELDEVAIEMNDLKAHFFTNYDQWIKAWEQKNGKYAAIIRSGVLSKAVVEKRIGFDFQVFQVNPVNEVQSLKINGMASGLSDELMDEIVLEANNFFHKTLKGKESCQANTQKTLKRLRDKVDGLSFLDGRFLAIVRLLDKTLHGYANVGKTIRGEQFYRVMSATLILSSKEKIQEYADGIVDVDSMANSFILGNRVDDLISDSIDANVSIDSVKTEQVEPASPVFELPDEDDIDQFFQKHGNNSSNGMFF